MTSRSDTFVVTPAGCLPFLRCEKLPPGGVILRVQRTQAAAMYLTDDQYSFSCSFEHLAFRHDDVDDDHPTRVLDRREGLKFIAPGMLVRVGVDGRYICFGSVLVDTIELVWKPPIEIAKIMEPAITMGLPLPPSSPLPFLGPDSTALPSPATSDYFDIISLADAVLCWQDRKTQYLPQLSSAHPWNRVAVQILQICKRPGRKSNWRMCFSDGKHYLWQTVPLSIMTHCHAKLVSGAVAWLGNWRLALNCTYGRSPPCLFEIISPAPLPPIGNPVSITTLLPLAPLESGRFDFQFNVRSAEELSFPVDISPALRDRFQRIDWESYRAKDGGTGYGAQPVLHLTKPAPEGQDPRSSAHIAEDAHLLSAFQQEVFYTMVALLTEPTLQLGNRGAFCEILRSYAVAAKVRGLDRQKKAQDRPDGVGPNPLDPPSQPPMDDDVDPSEETLKASAVAEALVAPETLSRIAKLIACPPPVDLLQKDQLKLAFLVSSVRPFPALAAQQHVREFVEHLSQLAAQRRFATDGAEFGVDDLVYAAVEAAGADREAPFPPSLLSLCQDILTNARSSVDVQAAVVFALARCADRKDEVLVSEELRRAARCVLEGLLAHDPGLSSSQWREDSRYGARGNHVPVAWECLVKLFPDAEGDAVLWHSDNLVKLLDKAGSWFPCVQDMLQLAGIEKLTAVDERTFLDDDGLVGWWQDHGSMPSADLVTGCATPGTDVGWAARVREAAAVFEGAWVCGSDHPR